MALEKNLCSVRTSAFPVAIRPVAQVKSNEILSSLVPCAPPSLLFCGFFTVPEILNASCESHICQPDERKVEFQKYGNLSICSMDKETLLQFRKNLSDVIRPGETDAVLLKWLRARNFNLRKSEQLYREHILSRKFYKLGEYDVYRMPKVIEKFNFANPLGVAKDGSPVYYIAMGRGDFKGFLNSLDLVDIGRYCTHEIEEDLKRCKEQSKKLGKDINEITYIVDMENFSLRQVFFQGAVETGFDLFQMLQDHYPEIWNHILLINAPYYFHTAFSIFKPAFRHTFVEKIFVASRDRSASLLLKYIDAEELPVFLGGKRVDSSGNTMCNEFMKFGGVVSEEYYIRNYRPFLQPTDPGVVDVWISPKSYYNYTFVIRERDSAIKVEVRTERGSIGGVVLYKEFGPDPEELDLPGRDEHIDETAENSPWKRMSPFVHIPGHISPISNYSYPPYPGIYVYKFDNSWNWVSSIRVIARITILPSGTEEF